MRQRHLRQELIIINCDGDGLMMIVIGVVAVVVVLAAAAAAAAEVVIAAGSSCLEFADSGSQLARAARLLGTYKRHSTRAQIHSQRLPRRTCSERAGIHE